MSDILTCQKCQTKNRVTTTPDGQVPVCARCGAPLPWLHDGTDASFEHDIQASVPVIVDFWAPWCGPCRMIAPALDELAETYAGRAKVVKVDIDQNRSTAMKYHVRSIPMLLLFKDGQVQATQIGAVGKAQLSQMIDKAL